MSHVQGDVPRDVDTTLLSWNLVNSKLRSTSLSQYRMSFLEVSVIYIWILLHLFSSIFSICFSSLALLSRVMHQPALPSSWSWHLSPSSSWTNPIGSIRSQVSAYLSNTTIQQWQQIPLRHYIFLILYPECHDSSSWVLLQTSTRPF